MTYRPGMTRIRMGLSGLRDTTALPIAATQAAPNQTATLTPVQVVPGTNFDTVLFVVPVSAAINDNVDSTGAWYYFSVPSGSGNGWVGEINAQGTPTIVNPVLNLVITRSPTAPGQQTSSPDPYWTGQVNSFTPEPPSALQSVQAPSAPVASTTVPTVTPAPSGTPPPVTPAPVTPVDYGSVATVSPTIDTSAVTPPVSTAAVETVSAGMVAMVGVGLFLLTRKKSRRR